MASVKKGMLAASKEWAKHLRPYWKRVFWKIHRKVEKQYAKQQGRDPCRL